MTLQSWMRIAAVCACMGFILAMIPPANEKKAGAPIRVWIPIALLIPVAGLITAIYHMIKLLP